MKNNHEKQTHIDEEYIEVSSDRKIWKPIIGDMISGTIVKRQKSNFGESFVLESDGEFYLLPNHRVLTDLLERCSIGSHVRIECIGTTPSKQGNDMMLYKVFVKKTA